LENLVENVVKLSDMCQMVQDIWLGSEDAAKYLVLLLVPFSM